MSTDGFGVMNIDKKKICNNLIIWLTGAIAYFYMEIAFRGFSHYSMFILGGLCFLTVGFIGKRILNETNSVIRAVLRIMILGTLIITSLEYITGIIVNVYLHLDVWNYSTMKMNIQGQICIAYSALWALLSLPIVYLNGVIRRYIFEE